MSAATATTGKAGAACLLWHKQVWRRAPDQVPDQSVTVSIWTLENAKVSVFDAPTSGLFERQSGEYVPKQALAVGSPEGGRQHTSEEAKP